MREVPAPPAVVVGVDGSRAAVRAALWAVDEAVSRDIPLRLVYALDPGEDNDVHPDDAARRLATAEIAVRSAVMAVESTDKPVTIKVEITQGHPTSTLVRASRSAVMVCVGAVGLNHFQRGRVGSTAAALASSAHCPVAIIRGHDGPGRRHADGIIVETDAGPRDGVVGGCDGGSAPLQGTADGDQLLAIPVHRHPRSRRGRGWQSPGGRPAGSPARALDPTLPGP